MANSETRPRASSEPPNLKQPLEVLEKLLEVELLRLDTAREIEVARKLVFPETSMIVRDIMRIQDRILELKNIKVENTDEFDIPEIDF